MALIIRIDIDRPYGKKGILRHILSRISADLYFPRVDKFGYLAELRKILELLNKANKPAYVFFRRCTFPSQQILELIKKGHHEIGLHLENSRSFLTFRSELDRLERHVGKPVLAFSKHGSGKNKSGRRHYVPYEHNLYQEWVHRAGMRVIMGNAEDPSIIANTNNSNIVFFPSAFWLEHNWRDTNKYTIQWLCTESINRDIVLLFHPDNVIAEPALTKDLNYIIENTEAKLL